MTDHDARRGRPVLVVEDSDEDFDTVAEAAQRSGVPNAMVHAVDAEDALRRLAGGAPGAFAFMLLDYNLTGLDGLTLLRHVRGDPRLVALPVVVFTTSVNPRDRDAFYAAGANAYHVKSVRYDACLQTLEAIFDYWLNRVTLPDRVPAAHPTGASE
jgi:two-component system, chemotaxis family, chemotaxis protein CheY